MANFSNIRFKKCLDFLKGNKERPEKCPETFERQPSRLLALPFELRLRIYQFCIAQRHVITITTAPNRSHWTPVECNTGGSDEDWYVPPLESKTYNLVVGREPFKVRRANINSIFLVSKQISEEALDVLYMNNIFKFGLDKRGEYTIMTAFTDRNRRRMRSLLLVAQPKGHKVRPEDVEDRDIVNEHIVATLLPHLKLLRLVLGQPVGTRGYYGAPTLEWEIENWINWLRGYLECFAQYMTPRTTVEVDYGGLPETGALVKECLPLGFQEVQCHLEGDWLFKRGQYSWMVAPREENDETVDISRN